MSPKFTDAADDRDAHLARPGLGHRDVLDLERLRRRAVADDSQCSHGVPLTLSDVGRREDTQARAGDNGRDRPFGPSALSRASGPIRVPQSVSCRLGEWGWGGVGATNVRRVQRSRPLALLTALVLVIAGLVVVFETPGGTEVTTTTLTPVADTYVDASTPTTNYGTNARIVADASPVREVLLRFDLSALSRTGPERPAPHPRRQRGRQPEPERRQRRTRQQHHVARDHDHLHQPADDLGRERRRRRRGQPQHLGGGAGHGVGHDRWAPDARHPLHQR